MSQYQSRLAAILGPTNTGKTYYAIERMLARNSGVIGLPLRLLAREVYDKVVTLRGLNSVALITGEERIVPAKAKYWVCTVEAMPQDIGPEFVAIDEIQLCADQERGHVFTDRLLNMRGSMETLFLGADTMRKVIGQLIPNVEFVTRSRFSDLEYTGPKKTSRMPTRSAIVGFSVDNVYAVAELLRRQKGGAAVVMGALSPRTRNAQVELYQNGDVDYVVATDAIGMGLNMDIDHVSFAATAKFDGRQMRELNPSELSQIAGRAGRYLNNGTFGCLTEGADYQTGLVPEMVFAIENHQFAPLTVIQWRNAFIDFSRAETVIRSLCQTPERIGLTRTMEKLDMSTFQLLSDNPVIKSSLGGPAAVKILWEVCQLPDFRQISDDEHIQLCSSIYHQITSDHNRISEDWMANLMKPLNNVTGNIDTLSTRIAHIRTLTYISNRPGWCENQKYWQSTTRNIEDKLSDALHEGLTKRFVSRRTSVLMRELRQKGKLMANIETDGSVYVEDHFIGTIEGFHFKEDEGAFGEDSKTLRNAATKVLADEIKRRAEEFNQADDSEISLIYGDPLIRSTINWRGVIVGRIVKGPSILTPKTLVQPTPVLQGDAYTMVQTKLDRWLDTQIGETLAPLFSLQEAVNGAKDDEGNERLTGMAKGIAFQILEKLGTIPRRLIAKDFKGVDSNGRFQIKKLGVWLGAASLYIPALLKPSPAQLRLLLWALFNDRDSLPDIPPAGLCTIKVDKDASRVFYEVSGYRVVGNNAVRLDMLERLANAAREVSMKGPFPMDADLMSLVGTSGDDFIEIMSYLGYITKHYSKDAAKEILARRQDLKVADEAINVKKVIKEVPAVKIVVEIKKENTDLPDKVILFTHKPQEIRRPNPINKSARIKNGNKPKLKGNTSQKKLSKKENRKSVSKPIPLDPDSPFALLAGLKEQLKSQK